MMGTIATLPNWKKDSTPGEWLAEVSGLAYERPARFQQIVVIYEEVDPENGRTTMRHQSYGVKTNTEIMGLLATAQQELFERMKGRRD